MSSIFDSRSRSCDNKTGTGNGRKRDHSWDRKWFDRLKEQQQEQAGTLRFLNPGKVSKRAAFLFKQDTSSSEVGPNQKLPPKSPSSKRRNPKLVLQKAASLDEKPQNEPQALPDWCPMSVIPPEPPELSEETIGLQEGAAARVIPLTARKVKRRIVIRTSPSPVNVPPPNNPLPEQNIPDIQPTPQQDSHPPNLPNAAQNDNLIQEDGESFPDNDLLPPPPEEIQDGFSLEQKPLMHSPDLPPPPSNVLQNLNTVISDEIPSEIQVCKRSS